MIIFVTFNKWVDNFKINVHHLLQQDKPGRIELLCQPQIAQSHK